jgi:hypothetical protein
MLKFLGIIAAVAAGAAGVWAWQNNEKLARLAGFSAADQALEAAVTEGIEHDLYVLKKCPISVKSVKLTAHRGDTQSKEVEALVWVVALKVARADKTVTSTPEAGCLGRLASEHAPGEYLFMRSLACKKWSTGWRCS